MTMINLIGIGIIIPHYGRDYDNDRDYDNEIDDCDRDYDSDGL